MKLTESPKGVYRSNVFGPSVTAAFSGRHYDNSKRSDYLRTLSLKPEALRMVKQVHGDKVLRVSQGGVLSHDASADGLVTNEGGVILGIRTADCASVFFHDPEKQAIGIAHAGWKGIKNGIIQGMLAAFQREFHSAMGDLCIVLGPSIRSCCYEVGEEFRDYFPDFFKPSSSAKGHFDLPAAVQSELGGGGVPKSKIHDTGICTVCQNDSFFSYRAEHKTKERVLSVISFTAF